MLGADNEYFFGPAVQHAFDQAVVALMRNCSGPHMPRRLVRGHGARFADHAG